RVASVTPGESGRPSVATPDPADTSSESTWPWEQPANLSTLVRPGAGRASRSALIVASVPEDTNRTISTDGRAETMSSASSTSPSVGAPNEVPSAAAEATALTTAGTAW